MKGIAFTFRPIIPPVRAQMRLLLWRRSLGSAGPESAFLSALWRMHLTAVRFASPDNGAPAL